MHGLFARTAESLAERSEALVELQVWPVSTRLDWRGWLSNFSKDEQFFARCLLEAFLYYGEDQARALLSAAFHGISRDVARSANTYSERETLWHAFIDSVVVTYVEGETPSPTDSGFAFARKARQVLGVDESRILRPVEALQTSQREHCPILFVDDFVGSGKQFESTWQRQLTGGLTGTFRDLARTGTSSIWYAPLIATQYGLSRLAVKAPEAIIRPAHTIGVEYSSNHDEALVWPSGAHDDARQFVEDATKRAGYKVSEAWGFHDLGLGIAITDTIPDACLPIFYSEKNNWRPLMARR